MRSARASGKEVVTIRGPLQGRDLHRSSKISENTRRYGKKGQEEHKEGDTPPKRRKGVATPVTTSHMSIEWS
jgi:hypothetical protein